MVEALENEPLGFHWGFGSSPKEDGSIFHTFPSENFIVTIVVFSPGKDEVWKEFNKRNEKL